MATSCPMCLATKLAGVLQWSQFTYSVKHLINHPNPAEAIHHTDCEPPFDTKIFYRVAVGRNRWLVHLDDALLLEKNDDCLGTISNRSVTDEHHDTIVLWRSSIDCNHHRLCLEWAHGYTLTPSPLGACHPWDESHFQIYPVDEQLRVH